MYIVTIYPNVSIILYFFNISYGSPSVTSITSSHFHHHYYHYSHILIWVILPIIITFHLIIYTATWYRYLWCLFTHESTIDKCYIPHVSITMIRHIRLSTSSHYFHCYYCYHYKYTSLPSVILLYINRGTKMCQMWMISMFIYIYILVYVYPEILSHQSTY